MKMKRRALTGLMLIAALCCFPAWAEVTLKPQASIDRAAVRLGDVFNGITLEQDAEIAVAPAPGRSISWDYAVLVKLAQLHGLDWRAGSTADKAVITRASHRIDQAMIREAVRAHIRDQGLEGDIEITLDNRTLAVDLPTDTAPDFTLSDFSFDRSSQRFRAELLAAADTPAYRQVTVTGRAVNAVSVPVLNRALNKETIIGKSDLEWIKMPADRADDYLRAPSAIIGMELRRAMPAQSALRPQDVTAARIVQRGNLVTMRISTPSLQITAQGRALQDGALGDVIRVTNTQSNRTIDARIIASGEVVVDMPVKFASAAQDHRP